MSPNPVHTDTLEKLLESKDQTDKLQAKLDETMKELDQKRRDLEKIINKQEDASKQLGELNVEYNRLKVVMEKDKEFKESLSSQLADLKKKQEEIADDARNFKKSAFMKDDIIATKDKQMMEKDQVIALKDGEIKKLYSQLAEVTAKIETSAAKIPLLQDQILALQKENEAVKLKEEKMNTQIHEATDKYEKLKVKFRDSGDSVLGATMEVEKLKADIKQKDDVITDLTGRLGSILTGGSGVLTDKEKLMEIFKTIVQKTQRSIRFCVPTISKIEAMGLLPVIKGFSRMTVVHVAGDIKATDEHIVMDLKQKGVIFTQYDQKDRWVLNRDGEDAIIALEKPEGKIIGFYSNEPRIVSILNSAIMEPWVKGIKI
jgi:chromosome segregation ATPase